MSFLVPFIPEIIGVGASLLGSHAANKQANNSIDAYQQAQDAATSNVNALRDQTRSDFAPYYSTGTGALTELNSLMTNPGMALQNDPFYKERLNQGVDALDHSAAAKHNLFSGGYGKDLTQFGQTFGSNELNSIFNRDNTLAGYGLDAARSNATVGTAATNALTDAMFRGAAGRSSGYAALGNNQQNTFGDLGGFANSALTKLLGRSGGAAGGADALAGLF